MKLLNKRIKIIVLSTISLLIIFFLNYKINTDISYHSGKDGGAFKRLESVIVLSVLFYFLMSEDRRILYGFIGFVVALLSTFIGLLIIIILPKFLSEDLFLHLIVIGVSFSSFFGVEKLLKNKSE